MNDFYMYDGEDAARRMRMQVEKFTDSQGREWEVRHFVNEANTRYLVKLSPVTRGPPWPKGSEHNLAMKEYRAGSS